MVHDPLLILAVNRLPGHNGWLKHRILCSLRDRLDLPGAILEYGERRSSRSKGVLPTAAALLREADAESLRLKRGGIGFLSLGDTGYPSSLALIQDPPMVLYHRGSPDFTGKSAVALVGTRRPSAAAQRQAFHLGLEFSLAGYPVVSGLAFGIDRAAHEGALAAGGVTWAVLAGGLDRPGPFSHRPLAARILENGGALLGEIPPGMFPAKYAFPRRNRILSGLCRGCIVVQAPAKSGALITADFALDQNRDLYVAASGMEGPVSEGTRNLESQGAPVIFGAAEVMADWGRITDIRKVSPAGAPQDGDGLADMMKKELDGRLFRYMGGWFEYRGA
jgi:DNA processing protein